jgi:hypothetical protein
VLLLAMVLAAGCDRNVAVGREDARSTVGGSAPDAENGGERGLGAEAPIGGEAGAGGNAGSDAAGTAGAGGDADSARWSADHETGNFDQWLGDGNGLRHVEGSGKLSLTSEHAHSGSFAFVATITANDGAEHQAVLGRDLQLSEGRYGAWYYLPSTPKADYWVIMKLSNGASVDRFDIDLEVATDGEPHLRLYEHDSGWITEPSSLPFPVARWVHVEALYRSTPAADGRVVVLQDGVQAVDSGPRATASDAHVAFFCGSVSRYVAPAPYRLFIDDASVSEAAVP